MSIKDWMKADVSNVQTMINILCGVVLLCMMATAYITMTSTNTVTIFISVIILSIELVTLTVGWKAYHLVSKTGSRLW
jgi:hypothetical protein